MQIKKGLHNYYQEAEEGQLLTSFECLKLSQAFCRVDSLWVMEDAESANVQLNKRQLSRWGKFGMRES